MPPGLDGTTIDQEIIVAERNAALRAAFAELPPGCQQLLSMLISDPPRATRRSARRCGIPVGSIGPTRARCLDRLRRSQRLAGRSGATTPATSATRNRRMSMLA